MRLVVPDHDLIWFDGYDGYDGYDGNDDDDDDDDDDDHHHPFHSADVLNAEVHSLSLL